MIIKFVSSKNYNNNDINCGDCILIDTGEKLIVYDCGCEEHAKNVIAYLNYKNYEKVDVILSHNDLDHFEGILYLIENNKVKSISTILLLKHLDDILDEINDKRRNRESVKNQIMECFDNIYKLTGNNLIDTLDETFILDQCVNFVGPNYDFLLEAVKKALDNSESDIIDTETIKNAISVQVEVIIGNHKILLTGDACSTAIGDKVVEYDAIQLPHHGKMKQAEEIFKLNDGRENVIYLVSDNTGNSNGGSDELMNTIVGKKIKNTKEGDIIIDINSFNNSMKGFYGL